jgi:protein required for attachment to host cells
MKLWILIADGSRARVFALSGRGVPLLEVAGFVHPASRLNNRAMLSDRPGRVRNGLGGKSATAMPRHLDPKEAAAETFVAELVQMLQLARERGEFELLALVAPPRFLGLLRARLDRQTLERVVATVNKELTRLEPQALRTHLAEVLEAAARAENAADFRS